MKTTLPLTPRILAALALLCLAALTAPAADLWFDAGAVNLSANGDGIPIYASGTWNLATTNWDAGASLPYTNWVNANLDTANFGGTYSTGTKVITLGSSLTVNQIKVLMGNSAANDANRMDIGVTTLDAVNAITFGGSYSTNFPALSYKSPECRNNQFYAKVTGTVSGGLVIGHGSNGADPNSGRLAILNTNNDFVGNLVLVSGNLSMPASNTLGNAANKVVLAGGSLFVSAAALVTSTFTGRDIVVDADSGINVNFTSAAGASLLNFSNMVITGSANLNRYSANNANGELRFTCDMSGYTGIVENRAATGAGIMTIQTTATSAGGWKVSGGILKLNTTDNTHIANGAGKTNLIMNGGTLNMNGKSETINGLEGASAASIVQNQLTNSASILTLGDADTTASYGGTIRTNSGTGGTLAVVKIGNGTQTLAGANQCSSCTVSAGTLEIGDGSSADAPFTSPVTNNAALTFNVTSSRTNVALITGAGPVSKTGGGTLTLAGTNSYTGPTLVQAGKLILVTPRADTGPIYVGAAELEVKRNAANAVITAARASADGSTLDFNFNLMGINANALLNLTGAFTNNGTTIINILNPGSMTVGSYPLIKYGSFVSNAFSSFSLSTISSKIQAHIANNPGNSSIDLVVDSVSTLTWTGAQGGDWDFATQNWVLNPGSFVTNFTSQDLVRFDDSATGSTLVTNNITVDPAEWVVTNSTKNYTFGGSGTYGGTAALMKRGSKTLTLAEGTYTYSGGTFIQGGKLEVGNGVNDPSLPGNIQNDATLAFNVASAQSPAGIISGTGTVTKSGAGALTLTGVNTYNGATTISNGVMTIGGSGQLGAGTYGASITDNGTFTYGSTASQTLSGVISGSGSLADSGSGTLTLSGANTYSGTSTLTAGTVALGVAENAGTSGPLGKPATPADSIDLSGGTLQYSAANQYDYSARFSTAAGQFYKADTAGQNVTWATALGSVGGSLTKSGSGTLSLTADNTFSGTATCSGGVLDFNGGSWTNTGASNLKMLMVNGGGTNWIHNNANLALEGWVDVGQNASAIGTMIMDGGALTINGISGGTPSDRGLTVGEYPSSTGTFNLNGGALTVTNSTVYVGQSSGGSGGATGTWNMANGTATIKGLTLGMYSSTGTLNLSGGTINIGTGGLAKGTGTANFNLFGGTFGAWSPWSNSVAMNLTNAGPKFDTTGGDITLSGVLSGGGALTKQGSGILTLSGVNTYIGNTTISNGTLALTGSGTLASANIMVASGATFDVSGRTGNSFTLTSGCTLMGKGTVNGSVSNAPGSILSPGASIGMLTVTSNLTIAGDLLFEVNKALSPSNDVINVGGAITNTGVGTLTVSNLNLGAPLTAGNKFTLFNQLVVGGSTLTIAPAPGAGLTWTNKLEVDGSIEVVASVATNPTNLVFSVGGGSLNLSWPANHLGWRLETQTNSRSVGLTPATNTWFSVPGAASLTATNFPINVANPTVFFRLVYP